PMLVGSNVALATELLTLNVGIFHANAHHPTITTLFPYTTLFRSGSNALTLASAGTLASGMLSVTNTASTTFAASLSGQGGLTEAAGAGSLILSVDDSYAGGAMLTSGSLIVGNSAALGTGMLTLQG